MQPFTDNQKTYNVTECESASLQEFFVSSGRDDVAALNEYLWSTLAPKKLDSSVSDSESHDVGGANPWQPWAESEYINDCVARANISSMAWPKSFRCAASVAGKQTTYATCAIREPSPRIGADSSSGNRSSARRRRRYRQAVAPIASVNREETEHYDEASAAASRSLKQRCSTLTHQLQGDHESQLLVASALRGAVWTFAQDEHGCRVVQLALSRQRILAESVTAELHGHVLEALSSPHANFVIQRLVEVMPTARSAFVAEELIGFAANAARHCYGCRILIRLLEHSATEEKTLTLIDEFLDEVADLAQHVFGHHVIQAVLEHGSPAHRHRIASALCQDGESSLRYALHRNASRVLEAAVLHCAPEDQSSLCDSLLNEPDVVLQGAQNSFGCYVLMAVIRHRGECIQTDNARHLIRSISDKLNTNKHGKRLLELLDHSNGDVPD